MDLLKLTGVSKKVRGSFAVKEISFSLPAHQQLAIAGETGSGKSTLLKLIAGILQPDEGVIFFDGKKVNGPNDQLIPGQAGIAYLSQHFELRNNYWVHEILSYANELPPEKAAQLYRICRIEQLLERRTDQLSGGEKQRIALTRLLIGAPRLLLLDEPFSNLDAAHKLTIKSILSTISAELDITCLMVSHDAMDLLPWAKSILVLEEGRIIQADRPEVIYNQPVNEYCASLFGPVNLLGQAEAAQLEPAIDLPAGKKLLVRPEQLVIVRDGPAITAIIREVAFMGSFYMLSVESATQSLKVKTEYPKFSTGDQVKLSMAVTQPWFV